MIKKYLFSIFLVFLTIAAIIVFSEMIVSFFYKQKLYLPDQYARRYPYEGSIFAQKVFKQEERYVGRYLHEGDYYINEKGYRGKNFSAAKPLDTIRIIIYGGSAVFDVGAANGKDWPNKVEKILNAKGYKNVEVINAGIPGLASFDSVGRLLSEGHLFEPDIVVLYNTYNDFRYFIFEKSLLRRFKPYIIDYRQEYLNEIDEFFCRHWKTYLFLRTIHFEKNIPHENRFEKAQKLVEQITPHSIKQFRLNILSFVTLVENINATPILVSEARMVSKDLKGDFDIKYSYDYLGMSYEAILDAFKQTDAILESIAREKKAAFIDTAKNISGKKENFIDIVHLSDAGGSAVAQLVAEEIAKQLSNNKFNLR